MSQTAPTRPDPADAPPPYGAEPSPYGAEPTAYGPPTGTPDFGYRPSGGTPEGGPGGPGGNGQGPGYDLTGTASAPDQPRPRWKLAALFTAATVAAGATGSGLTLLANDRTAAAPVTITRSSTVAVPAGGPAGTAQAAAAVIGPSVVTIAVSSGQGFGGAQRSGTGSGVVLRADGYIVTNNHVVAAAAGGGSVRVTFSDGQSRAAQIVGTDPSSDLAVIKVGGPADLSAATFADSDQLAVGQSVLAVGAPLGLSNTVTEGIVSTLNRPVRTGENASEQSVIDAVQTDAAINPGNSGGALVDSSGQVVGIPSAIATAGSGSGNIGVGFAIPSNDATEVAEELIADGTASHAQMGVSVGDAEASTSAPAGARVAAVNAGGPAAEAGLAQGDVVTKVADRPVTDADSLIVAVRGHEPGERVEVTYRRGGQTRTAIVTMTTAPTR